MEEGDFDNFTEACLIIYAQLEQAIEGGVLNENPSMTSVTGSFMSFEIGGKKFEIQMRIESDPASFIDPSRYVLSKGVGLLDN